MADVGLPIATDDTPVRADAAPASAAPKLVPALAHAIAIINFLNERGPRSATLAELSSSLKITKSHCRSILLTLVHVGWVKFDERAKTYQLYSGLLASGSSLLASPVLARVRERLNDLVTRTGFSCILTQPQPDDSFVVIENFTAARSMEVSYPIGFHFPKDAPAQMRAYMAWQGDDRLAAWLAGWKPNAYTSTSILTAESLIREVEATRRRGYSRSFGEHFEGLMAFGLPIFGRSGDVSYVFCVMGFINDLPTHETSVTELMKRTVRDIHNSTMANPPPSFLPDFR